MFSTKSGHFSRQSEPIINGLLGLVLAGLAVLLLVFAAANIWLMIAGDWIPIDEMVFGDISRMITQGYPLFGRMWDVKPPVTHYFVAPFIGLFGNTLLALRLASIVVMLWTTLVMTGLVWALTKARFITGVAGLAALVYAAWSAHIEGFNPVVMMAAFTTTAALVAVLANGRRALYAFSGVLLAWSFFSKPVMVLEALAILALAAYFAPAARRTSATVWVIIGGLLGVGAMLVWAWSMGVLESMWLNAFYNGFLYSFEPSNSEGRFGSLFIEFFNRYFIGQTLPFILPLVVMAVPAAYSLLRQRGQRGFAWIILGWCLAALMGALVGRSMRRTYFVEIVPPFLVLCTLAIVEYRRYPAVGRAALVLLLSVALVQSDILGDFDQTLMTVINTPWRSPDAAPQVVANRPTADFLAAVVPPDECVWQWDGFGMVTYLANRLPCQSAFATQPLMVAESFDYRRHRAEYMNEIIRAKPNIHTRNAVWHYFPELQRLVNRYVKAQLFSGTVDIFAVDWSAWHDTHIHFGAFTLIGYDILPSTTVCVGDTLQVAFTWRLNHQPVQTSNLFVQLLTPDFAERMVGIDTKPHSDLPITAWDYPGMIYLSDTLTLTIPTTAIPGTYPLVTGFYDVTTLQPLIPKDAAGQAFPANQALLTKLVVNACE